MTIINIFDKNGLIVNQLDLNDDLQYINGRVSKGKKLFYKGTGIKYYGHNISDITSETSLEYDVFRRSPVFYSGYEVSKKCFQGKFGIFQEKYQPFFTDHIGSCGTKEGLIVLNSSIFLKSSVDVIDYIEFDKENKQSYVIIDYKCDRKKFIDDDGDVLKLKELIEYCLDENWNFLWDKNTISDITKNGLVSDPADIFMSKDLSHKIGTVYSLIFSLGKGNIKKYLEFIKQYNLNHYDDKDFLFNALKILRIYNINTADLYKFKEREYNFWHIVINWLITGLNCAYCSCNMYQEQGDLVRNSYRERVINSLPERIRKKVL